ncbi:50S ribosomal protein L13 [Candidatus Shapirobacteria bacterium CG08_land_8_20_14_0_20_39_18]|uniref:Large ribosomal subunit protein uL13 n=1 Tax=Candidatus Shapirobacteria bacterium CG08_land_8_20_14_0_20_39_18 TaxID=1974883 RepID=A0A2M6XE78_9BACT|nr:MAG: 50S ribosomal protein L13 [Candidatus Shapirobacteria bacterium CG08_land_8_20_14_0_20_39_18]PIY66431.1 MAG: 50S ribosomal protein L13 [Candidatus Shapirobacteria bacterium CG_4_10_14_0_8_um_filter_39_15]PJE68403.1 MAG: 50S ribosomal protein L13 [Candidatus Shapirobacteria bacterium CG10_big_fil_rev_8_21_14_0_10_38_8]
MKTYNTKQSDIQRVWHLIDAHDQVVGRLSTKIAGLLMGKSKPYFIRNLGCGDFVVVINAQTAKLTGNKENKKNYYHHTGYPAGLRTQTASQVRASHPDRLISHAVAGMLPQNKLKDKMLTRLYVYSGSEHPYGGQFK